MELKVVQIDNGNYQKGYQRNYQRNNGNYQGNNRNYQGNVDRRCYGCNEIGHI